MRTSLIASTVQDSLTPLVRDGATGKIAKLFNRMIQDERLYALGFCDPSNKLLYKTQNFPEDLRCVAVAQPGEAPTQIVKLLHGALHIALRPIQDEGGELGNLLLVHDMSFVARRSGDTKRYVFYLFVVLGAVISGLTVLIAQLSWKGWVQGIQSLIKGEGLIRPVSKIAASELKPIAKDLRALIHDLEVDRKARDESQITWSPRTLKEILHNDLAGDEILIVANRQPYIHVLHEGKVEIQIPASGLVTALEPVMRACSGTWIAHGSGNADKTVVDKDDHVRVPPENPSYQIRRVWLTQEEEAGYYYGFANEGLWPLCHIAHVRPMFRAADWNTYVKVNEKFAKTVVEEAKTENPVVLVQDYHFALLPRLIKRDLPDATVITFWHIPWPNPEAFGICPWRDEILDGLLGSNILGFHTRFHCNNFMDTVDRFIECRVDRETSTISYGGKLTAVSPYPISIEWPTQWMKTQKPIAECRSHIRALNGMPADRKVGVGVDRLDYTKGILERFLAIERFLELRPEWVGKMTFVQIAAPSRSSIEQYQAFEAQVRAVARRINTRFGGNGTEPICLKVEHHEPEKVYEYFRGADFCFVSSLHDGMNLVAKEFVAARDDERGGLIQEFNVYRWAGRMLMDASRIRSRQRFTGRFGETKLESQPIRVL